VVIPLAQPNANPCNTKVWLNVERVRFAVEIRLSLPMGSFMGMFLPKPADGKEYLTE